MIHDVPLLCKITGVWNRVLATPAVDLAVSYAQLCPMIGWAMGTLPPAELDTE